MNENYCGRVPDEIDELIKFKGVGRKTANLVVTLGYNKPGICVDTHVHRISNRWGYVKTATPEKTEVALRQKLPKQYWIEYNDLLVSFGQQLCRPISPLCSQCPVAKYCSQIGVTVKTLKTAAKLERFFVTPKLTVSFDDGKKPSSYRAILRFSSEPGSGHCIGLHSSSPIDIDGDMASCTRSQELTAIARSR